jgi:hypothetical protein
MGKSMKVMILLLLLLLKGLVKKPERKRPLERPRYRREDNSRMDLYGVG